MDLTGDLAAVLEQHPRASLVGCPTPVERQARLSDRLGIELFVKRDDLNLPSIGGNKVRQLEYYLGRAQTQNADTLLVTGAVQSNFTRLTAACAAKLGFDCHIQLEERVADVDAIYRSSGNVLLEELLGAKIHFFPRGDDEQAADAQLEAIAEGLRGAGRRPFVIPLGADHPPLGALGYMRAAVEMRDELAGMNCVVVGSGSGQTHAGLLFGLRALQWDGVVLGVCVRRPAVEQGSRILGICERIAGLTGLRNPVADSDVQLCEAALAPGYGITNRAVAEAICQCARLEGLLLDPVYTGRVMAGLIAEIATGRIRQSSKVMMIHTGGLGALFAYERDLRQLVFAKTGPGTRPDRIMERMAT